jgi:hypothetical protein
MKLKPEQIAEIERLASVLATARVVKYRARTGQIETVTLEQAAERLEQAEGHLRLYLEAL